MHSSTRTWTPLGRVPPHFHPQRIVAFPGGTGLMFGQLSETRTSPEHTREAAVFSAGPAGIHRTLETPGWVIDAVMTSSSEGVCAVATPANAEDAQGVRRALWFTNDSGTSWSAGPSFDDPDIRTLFASTPEDVWAMSLDALHHTGDGGASWRTVEAPGPIDPALDRLFAVGRAVVLAKREGLFITMDQGRRWAQRPVDGAHVRAVSANMVAALHEGTLQLGRMTGDGVDWLGGMDVLADPIQVVSDGTHFQMSCVAADLSQRTGIIIVEPNTLGSESTERSVKGGLVSSVLRVPADGSWIGLAGMRAGMALTLNNEVLAAADR